jgi:hypothetical protein
MGGSKADIKADIKAVVDRGEDVRLMEPPLIGETARDYRSVSMTTDFAGKSRLSTPPVT